MSDVSLLLVLCAAARTEAVHRLLDEHGARGFTEIPEVLGAGVTGKHLGTRAFPGEASLVFTVLPQEQAREIVEALQALAASCPPGEGLKVFSLEAKELV